MEQAHVIRPDSPFFNPYTRREEYKWAAMEVAVAVSRQNGKGSILEARELAGLFLFGERLIIHSAHLFDTSLEAFERILQLIENTPELDREVANVNRSHGKEGIDLKNGQRLRFRARTKGGGRGFTCDCLILDEAMYLPTQTISALLPTLSARPNPQIWITGSAGTEESEHFGRVRARAIDEDSYEPRLFYAEWSIDKCNDFCVQPCDEGHDQPGDEASWAKANPGYGIRIGYDSILMEYNSMDPAEFLVERLGVGRWPTDGSGWKVISKEAWRSRINLDSEIKGRVALAVDTAPDSAFTSITACGYNQDDECHVELTFDEDGRWDYRPGTTWVVPRLKQLWKAEQPYAIVIDKVGQAGQFVPELEAAGIKVICPNTREYAQACGEFKTAVLPRKDEEAYLTHVDQLPLNNAMAAAGTRALTDMWAWSKRDSHRDISPLVSATLAMWGLKQCAAKKKTEFYAFYL